MRPKTKFLIGGLVVLGTSGWLMFTSIKETGEYYMTPSELSTKLKAEPGFKGADVRVGARVVPGSIVRQPSGREYSFRITDGTDTMSVVYKGIAPDTFSDSSDVVVVGFATEGTFQAGTLLAKCASRYENAPPGAQKYRETAGYKAGKKA
jgi:cytochrome c-type biogenesis protein CcmE